MFLDIYFKKKINNRIMYYKALLIKLNHVNIIFDSSGKYRDQFEFAVQNLKSTP